MGFGIDGRDLPLLRNYARAKAHHDSIVPIRNSNNLRPLGDRRKHHQRIEDGHAGDVAGIACVLYATACVIYYEDGTIHLQHGGYVSQSTCTFIKRIAPVSGVRMDSKRGCLVVRVAGGEYQCGEDGLRLKQDELGGYVPVDPVPFSVTLVNRSAMREVKKQYAAFLQYAVGLAKLTQWERPGGDERFHWLGDTHGLLSAMRSDDIERWAWAYPRLMLNAGLHQSYYNSHARQMQYMWACDKKRVDSLITRLVKQEHASAVLVREALPLGVHKIDPNANYVDYIREV